MNGLRAVTALAVETAEARRARQRDALIDHLIDAHDAQDRVACHWPDLHTLRREHTNAHMPIGSKYSRPGHRHTGSDPWQDEGAA